VSANGGPAFPALNFIVPDDLAKEHVHRLGETRGMSLRDWFAAAAIVYMSSDAMRHAAVLTAQMEGITATQALAISCYEIADAMLKEREKTA
jgi:hypothetical protein